MLGPPPLFICRGGRAPPNYLTTGLRKAPRLLDELSLKIYSLLSSVLIPSQ